MRILTFSTLFPNAALPQHGIFVAERLRHLLGSGAVDATVVAPVPWFPGSSSLFPEYSKWSMVPREEEFEGVRVLHPRYPVIPKIGMTVAPVLLALWSLQTMRKVLAEGRGVDVIDAHYFYPDGVAASLLGKWFKRPVVITGRGTDLNLIPQYWLSRRQIQWASTRAAALVTVSQSLRNVLTKLDVPESKTQVIRNGVDLDVFAPVADRMRVRADLGISGVSILAVGNLVELKGHDLVIKALQSLPENFELRIAGDGPMRTSLERTARDCGVKNRVQFLGRLARRDLVKAYNAADLLVLASSREGMANVLLESMACGTPVLATDVGGSAEVVNDRIGELVLDRNADDLAFGIKRLIDRGVSRMTVRRHAGNFSWDETTRGQLDIFERVVQSNTL